MVYENKQQLLDSLSRNGVTISASGATVEDEKKVRGGLVEDLVRTAVFSSNDETKNYAREIIHELARTLGAVPASIQGLYDAIGRGEVTKQFTVPAHNIRALTYDVSAALFRAAMKHEVGPFIFEIARSEIGYTDQPPAEYAACVLAAAIKEGYKGPVFIQGDHFQASAKKWATADREKERKAIESLINEAIAAEFYNIDIDTSTLVDLSFPTVDEQQRPNYENTAYFTKYIRERQPKGYDISVGGEIGEVGHSNTTPEEFRAYVEGYKKLLGAGVQGISKVSIQTGTSHGGVPLPDGRIAEAKIDFKTLEEISMIARKEYGIGGAVQHGASTLPEEVFDNFPKHHTTEIHLATGFQNMILDSPAFPKEMRQAMVDWCWKNAAGEKKEKETDEQFIYKTRKKTIGPFKRQMWDMPAEAKKQIVDALQAKFEFLFGKLGVVGTKDVVAKYIDLKAVPKRQGSLASSNAMAFVNEGEGE